jgi:phospholipase/carboxylesterase
MLLMLHGVGSHEGDLHGLSPVLDPRLWILSLRAPFHLAPGHYAWFSVKLSPVAPTISPDQAEHSRSALVEFVPWAVRAYSADPRRVYLLGFSQGAIMSLAVALTRPDLVAGVAALGGRTLPELFAEDGPLAGHLASKDNLRGLPVLVLHGVDDPVLPVHFARETRTRLQPMPIDLEYQELPGGHSLSAAGLEIVQRWLARRLDGPAGEVREDRDGEDHGSGR